MERGTKKLSLISFFAITASMVMTVYEYPTFATSKMNLVFYLLVGGFLWFIPVALCSAEMATIEGWEKGGLYTWVSKTLGRKWGFAAIFFQWFQITVGFITMIYFIVGALSYALNWPDLNTNVWLKLIGTLLIFWLITISQFGGTKNTVKIAKIGFFVGILATGFLLFALSIIYIVQGNPIKVSFGKDAWIPDFTKINTLVVFVSFILAYAGVESSASHVKDMENPGKDYPMAILMLVISTIILDTLGGATVAATIPQDQLSLDTGVVQAYSYLIHQFGGEEWIVRIISIVICLGVIAEIATWVIGPSTAMLEAAKNGLLPKQMTKVNKHNVPINIVLIQGIIVSIWAVVLTLGGGGANLSFFVAMALTVCIYLVAYVLLFLSYIKLVRKNDNLKRAYHIPGGKKVKIGVAIIGLFVSIFAFFISFFPPNDIGYGKGGTYLTILIISWLIILSIPFLIYKIFDENGNNK
ncbi:MULTISPECIES: amino acid permease [Enterococcus]|uniref:amino acid permease n=1 Tax=Enterococcus TaxID=1350 RepID=UPI000CF12DDE|nr:amino acid permease [Enterococcus faecium]EGP4846708.1 amino acid permease [Enterococcus faecium]EGP4892388.1 amino acid permease [Enterococcus faecium]EGP4915256.1 amino acid permease [Enterococcus faecium]EGP4917717.1 amino acid permease [Enterococcus faecium]EGP5169411.1 amino acid permease [Enterococcus faecium]